MQFISIVLFIAVQTQAEFTQAQLAVLSDVASRGRTVRSDVEIARILDEQRLVGFTSALAAAAGSVEAVASKTQNDPFWTCILDLKNCFSAEELGFLDQGKWEVAFSSAEFVPETLKAIVDSLVAYDGPQTIAVEQVTFYRASAVLRSIIANKIIWCKSGDPSVCAALKVMVDRNALTRAISILSMNVSEIDLVFGLSGNLLGNDIIRNSCWSEEDVNGFSLYVSFVDYWKTANPSIPSFFYQVGTSQAEGAGGLLNWQVCSIKKSFIANPTEASFQEAIASAGGRDVLLRFFVSTSTGERSLRRTPHASSYNDLFACMSRTDLACWNAEQEALISSIGLIKSFNEVGRSVHDLQKSTLLLTLTDDWVMHPLESLDISAAMEKLWIPNKIVGPLAVCLETGVCQTLIDNVNRNNYTRALVMKRHNRDGVFNIAALFRLPEGALDGNPAVEVALEKLLNRYSISSIHNLLVAYMSSGVKVFDVSDFLVKLGESSAVVNKSPLELETIRLEIGQGSLSVAETRVLEFLDEVGVETGATYFSSEPMRGAIIAAKIPSADCLVALRDCFTEAQIEIITRIGWAHTMQSNHMRDLELVKRSLDLIYTTKLEPLPQDAQTIESVKLLVSQPLIFEPLRNCKKGNRDACAMLRRNIDQGNLLVKAVAIVIFQTTGYDVTTSPVGWATDFERVFHLPKRSVVDNPVRARIFDSTLNAFQLRDLMARFMNSRYVERSGIFSMLDFLDHIDDFDRGCGKGDVLLTKLMEGKDVTADLKFATAVADLHCNLNASFEWRSERNALIQFSKEKDNLFGTILELIEALPRDQRSTFFAIPKALSQIASRADNEAISFFLAHAPRSTGYRELLETCASSGGICLEILKEKAEKFMRPLIEACPERSGNEKSCDRLVSITQTNNVRRYVAVQLIDFQRYIDIFRSGPSEDEFNLLKKMSLVDFDAAVSKQLADN